MSASNRSGPRWSSSAKSNVLLPARKKLPQPLILHQHTCAQRMAKTKHDVEQLFKIYYTSNIKFNTFEKHVVTGRQSIDVVTYVENDVLGTRIPSAVQTPMINSNHLDHSSSNVFRSKHCVSREDDNAGEIDEHVIINDETAELQPKRSVQKRIDQQSLNNLTSTRNSLPLSPDTIPSLNDLNESLSEDEPIESIKRAHSTITALPSISSINLRKDFINSSDSSFSTVNTYQPHMITGSAVVVRERSPSKSTSSKQRIKSSNQQTNFKTRFVCTY